MSSITLHLPENARYMDLVSALNDLADKLNCDRRLRESRQFVFQSRENKAQVLRFPVKARPVNSGFSGGAA